MKKLASMRQSASAGSLTVKSLSMCLACNRPIYQSDDTVKHSQNTRLGPANHSIMAERHRQQGVHPPAVDQLRLFLPRPHRATTVGAAGAAEREYVRLAVAGEHRNAGPSTIPQPRQPHTHLAYAPAMQRAQSGYG